MAQHHDRYLRKNTVFRKKFVPEVILGTNNEKTAKKTTLQIKTKFNQKQTNGEQLNTFIKCVLNVVLYVY